MKKLRLLLAGGLIASSLLAHSQDAGKKGPSKNSQKKPDTKAPASAFKLNNKIDSVSYSLGILITENLQKEGLDNLNANALAQAIRDVYSKEGKIDARQAETIVMNYSMDAKQEKAKKNLEKGQKFLEENKKKDGVVTLPSGLQYMVLKEGTGPKPTANDVVKTHYHGTLIDGTVFDSSVERGEPASFKVNGVIPGWVEALQLMSAGSKWRLFIPSNLAYGERGAGGSIGPNETLIFDVELLSIEGK